MRYERWFRGALSALFVVSTIVAAPGTARSQTSAVNAYPSLHLGADREDAGRTGETVEAPDAFVLEELYATAVAKGFEDRQVVEAALAAMADRVSGHQLQRIYADAVLANAVPLSDVRQSLREMGHKREVWEEWPRDKANIIYALSIVSGGEPDSAIRERLRAAIESAHGHGLRESTPNQDVVTEPARDEGEDRDLVAVSQPDCDAECGPEDPEHPFNIYETDMYREWVLWYEWFHGGACPACWTPWELLVDAERIEALVSEACAISNELSRLGPSDPLRDHRHQARLGSGEVLDQEAGTLGRQSRDTIRALQRDGAWGGRQRARGRVLDRRVCQMKPT